MTALLPCPFCGQEGVIRSDYGHFFATCSGIECFCCVGEAYDRDAMPNHMFCSEDEAAAAWNRRAT